MMLDDAVAEIESELLLTGRLERVYRRDASKPDKPLLLDDHAMASIQWTVETTGNDNLMSDLLGNSSI